MASIALADGTPFVTRGPVLTLWRAPTDNDGVRQGWMAEVKGARIGWMALGLDHLDPSVEDITSRRGQWTVRRRAQAGDGGEVEHRTRIRLVNGSVRFDEEVVLPSGWVDLPRVGVVLRVAGPFDRLQWHGLGPDETYPDRRRAGTVGLWTSTAAEQTYPYVMPQETGAHVDTRWFALRNRDGLGAAVAADRLFAFAARHVTDAELSTATTSAAVTPSEDIEVHVDAAIRGLGTGACGPDTLAPYLVKGGTWRFTWWITPTPRRRGGTAR
jgi:beta-galactosidase